jgi:hypothetical protein
MIAIPTPARDEAAAYYFTYIDQVESGEDIVAILERQMGETLAFLRSIPDGRTLHRYEPGKWTIREVVGHLSDCERLFVFRAFWFGRGFDSPLPSFDQNVANATAGANERSWDSLVYEFRTVREATLTFFRDLPADAWTRRGIASDNAFTVRALAYIAAGHVIHHVKILKERYL